MTYAARETSQALGEPIELFRFIYGSTVYTYTSADVEQSRSGETYTPAPIHRGQLELDGESLKGAIEISVPRDNPIAAPFVAYAPEPAITVTVISRHRSEAQEVVGTWEIGHARFEGAECHLTCVPTDANLRRRIPRNTFQAQCNWALYSPQCGVNKDLFKVLATVTVISGETITGSAFSSQPDGWFNNGWVERANGERRWIVKHVGTVLTLVAPFATLLVNEQVTAFAGCERTEAVCASKFANLDNHFGFARVPTRNPFGSALGSGTGSGLAALLSHNVGGTDIDDLLGGNP
jgi:uncharacterized phage protein (TIGR02218 family)